MHCTAKFCPWIMLKLNKLCRTFSWKIKLNFHKKLSLISTKTEPNFQCNWAKLNIDSSVRNLNPEPIFWYCRNPEIQAIVPILLSALQDPAKKTGFCLQTLLQTQFVHFIGNNFVFLRGGCIFCEQLRCADYSSSCKLKWAHLNKILQNRIELLEICMLQFTTVR